MIFTEREVKLMHRSHRSSGGVELSVNLIQLPPIPFHLCLALSCTLSAERQQKVRNEANDVVF
jgi:hypothetical protein